MKDERAVDGGAVAGAAVEGGAVKARGRGFTEGWDSRVEGGDPRSLSSAWDGSTAPAMPHIPYGQLASRPRVPLPPTLSPSLFIGGSPRPAITG